MTTHKDRTYKSKKGGGMIKTLKNRRQQSSPGFTSFESALEKSSYFRKDEKNIEKELIKMFKTPFTPSKITPNNDFYTYINYRWLKDTEKQYEEEDVKNKYYVQVDSFRIVQDHVYKELIEIVKEYISKNDTKQANMISNIYKSSLHSSASSIKNNIAHGVETYNKYIQEDNLWSYMAHINGNEIISWACPICWTMLGDEKESGVFRNSISFPQLSLYDSLLYFEDEPEDTIKYKFYRKVVRSKFLKYVNKIFTACLGEKHGLNAQDVLDCETDILMSFGCSVKGVKDSPTYYNKVYKEDAMKYGFDWEQFSSYLGYKKTPDFFICSSLSYLSCICKLFNENWKTQKWKSFWMYIYLRQLIRFDKKLNEIHYDFNGRFLKGQPNKFPENIYPVFLLSFAFNTFLTNEYVARHKDEQIIKYVEDLGADLIHVYKRIIGRNTWLSPSTKKSALLKLDYLKLEIAHPKKLRYDPLLKYEPDDAFGNAKKLARWKTQKYVLLEGRDLIDIPIIDWNTFKLTGSQAYIVNAFYTATENKIYIPLAYLQKPFIDLNERGIEYNLAHIGDTLAHEMSHALDDYGSKYDHLGNMKDWWTASDKKKYSKIIKDIIKQYEVFAAYDNIKFDASISIGEDMADISALAICEEYLRDFQIKNKDIVPIKSLSFQAFFVYFAVQQRQHIYKRAFEAQLKTNPHPMDKYRTNVPLSRLELFRSLYNIKKGDQMWWHSTSTIW